MQILVTPVLKKGDKKLLENYRPVTCLPATSKLLEMIVCEQTTEYFDKNFNSHRNIYFEVVQDWYKSIFRIKVPEPYPISDGGQN